MEPQPQQNPYVSQPGEQQQYPYQAQNVYGPPPGVAPQYQNQPQNYQPMPPQPQFPNQQEYQAQEKSIVEQIREISDLKNQGILTEEEFKAAKQKIINQQNVF